jgi:hypothetical protein
MKTIVTFLAVFLLVAFGVFVVRETAAVVALARDIVRYAVGTPLTEMVERIQEFLDRSAAPSLRLWWMQWVMSALSIPFLLVFLLIVAAGSNMARRQLGVGGS